MFADIHMFNFCLYFPVQDDVLWCCLAAMSAYAKELNTAEIAYASIKEVFQSFRLVKYVHQT